MQFRSLAVVFNLGLMLSASIGLAQEASFSQGPGEVLIPELAECPGRPTPLGTVTSTDGRQWIVPAEVAYQDAPRLPDLFNQCTGVTPGSLSAVEMDSVPIVEIDPDGEVITGYLLGDNYFELYINGELVGVDSILFTPFNSALVRFRVNRPYTIAVKLVDWEENTGMGTEAGRAGVHPGDGGFIAGFSDGTVTDASWKAQSFYISPLNDPSELVENGNIHDTSALGRVYPDAPDTVDCGESCYAAHYPVPADWMNPGFNAAGWPDAFVFTHAEMGLDNQRGYNNFSAGFGDASVIWSLNLVYDNLVLVRKTVE